MKGKAPHVREEVELELNSLDEAAAVWSEALREAGGDAPIRDTFEAWRARSPEHAAAFQRVEFAHAAVQILADTPEMLALRRETLSRVARRRSVNWARYGAIAASLIVAVLVGGYFTAPKLSENLYYSARNAIAGNVYQTGVGQRSVFTLQDGSVITLNTASRVSVHYNDRIRAVTLEKGQALFQVAKDRAHPFIVTADGRQVTALGTEFDVRLSGKAFEVTLLEGRVAVARETHASATTTQSAGPASSKNSGNDVHAVQIAELTPGQQLVDTQTAPPVVREADVKRITSWRNGQVVFEDEKLASAVAEMNRYARRQIVLGDDRLTKLKISGAFDTGKTDTFVEALTVYFPIEVAAQDGDTIVLKSRATAVR